MNKTIRNYELDDKVEDFIIWYKKNFKEEIEYGLWLEPKEILNFIEKVAVWYELRYPDYEVNRLYPGINQETKEIDEVMFYDNEQINFLIGDTLYRPEIKWSEFYNKDVFLNSLPCEEYFLLTEATYQDFIRTEINGKSCHVHLDLNGKITEAEGMGRHTNCLIKDEELKGRPIEQLDYILKWAKAKIEKPNKIEMAINSYRKEKKFKDELLNSIMYRIIERGGNRIGPRRAFIFAKEFDRSIDIPIIYGIDYSDPGLLEFIANYMKLGGNLNLECIVGYGSRKKKNQVLYLNTLSEVIGRKGITEYENFLDELDIERTLKLKK